VTDLSGRTAIVTGASRGLGEITARLLARAGANVALAARSQEDIARVAADIRASGGSAEAFPCDVAIHDEVAALVAATESRFGAVDILVNNAGVIDPIAFIADSNPEEWGRLIDINVKGVYHGMRAALPGMLARGSGTIVTVGSGAAHFALDAWSAYCASKAAAVMLTMAGHKETGDRGIVHINLSPGTIATDMQVRIRASGVNPVSQIDPDDLGDPAIPAQIIVWLCGPGGVEYAGQEVRAGDPDLRRKAGLG